MEAGCRATLAGASVLTLAVGSAAGQGLINPRICDRDDLSADTQAFCESIEGLEGRDLFKARLLESLRRINRPPVADLRLAWTLDEQTILPNRVDLNASGSSDWDGFVAYYDIQLLDNDTGLPLSRLITTRHPLTTIHLPRELPPNLLAVLTVTDDVGATDTTKLAFASDGTVTD